MANNTITFNPESGVPYGVNLTIYQKSTFRSTFQVNQENKSAFNLTGYSITSKLKKSVAIGASTGGIVNFGVSVTGASAGQFKISLTNTQTGNLQPGRYHFDINAVSTGSTHYKLASGNVVVEGGL